MRAAVGWCACEVSVPVSRSRPAPRAAPPECRGAQRPRAGSSGAEGPAQRIPALAAAGGRPGREQRGWLQEH